MAGRAAVVCEGPRLGDRIGVGLIARAFPSAKVHAVLAASGRASQRERVLPAHVVVYYVIALALYMPVSCREVLRCLLEGLHGLLGRGTVPTVAAKSAISQARTRLGFEVMRHLHDEIVAPLALPATKGAWYGDWRLVSLDGSTLDVADEDANATAFGRPASSRGDSAFPQIRFVSLVENGTHVLFASRMAGCTISEIALAREILPALRPGMLCLADRNFFGFAMWRDAQATGADLVWRTKKNLRLACDKRLPDNSYLSRIFPSDKDRRHATNALPVRVIEYYLDNVPDAEPIYRLVTTILDHRKAPAEDLAALYHERWEIESALDELKTHLRGARIILRSKTPDLVRQEFFGLLMAHFAIRSLMHEAALAADIDPDRLSFTHAVRVVRRKLPLFLALSPSPQGRAAQGHAERDPGRARSTKERTPHQTRRQTQDEQLPAAPPSRQTIPAPLHPKCHPYP